MRVRSPQHDRPSGASPRGGRGPPADTLGSSAEGTPPGTARARGGPPASVGPSVASTQAHLGHQGLVLRVLPRNWYHHTSVSMMCSWLSLQTEDRHCFITLVVFVSLSWYRPIKICWVDKKNKHMREEERVIRNEKSEGRKCATLEG